MVKTSGGTDKIAYDILSVPPEDREAVIDQLYNPEGNAIDLGL
ncbi:hypothetical protein [Moorena sp. SIO3A2]|nr:hypothetical protein [Moorena sp. SIO3A2]